MYVPSEIRYATGSREVAMVTSRSQTIRCQLGSVTLTGQGLGLGLGTSLFPVGATEIKGLPWQPSRRIAGFVYSGPGLFRAGAILFPLKASAQLFGTPATTIRDRMTGKQRNPFRDDVPGEG